MFVRSPFNYDVEAASDEAGLECLDDPLTIQDAKEETDINVIVRRFGLTGTMPQNLRLPTYGDFTDVDDYHSAANAIALANESFEKIPAEVRARFNNSPGEFVDFCSNPANREEMLRLGLLREATVEVVPVTEPEGTVIT